VIGSNTTACHPIVAQRIMRAKEKGAKLIVADPRRIQLSRFADVAVQHRLGSDVALLNGMMQVIIENHWQADAYITQRTEGFGPMTEAVAPYTPSRVQAITGVAPGDLCQMARLYAMHPPRLADLCHGYHPAHLRR
jgi:anaerobic selenocysteine-containing dehydrogenase